MQTAQKCSIICCGNYKALQLNLHFERSTVITALICTLATVRESSGRLMQTQIIHLKFYNSFIFNLPCLQYFCEFFHRFRK